MADPTPNPTPSPIITPPAGRSDWRPIVALAMIIGAAGIGLNRYMPPKPAEAGAQCNCPQPPGPKPDREIVPQPIILPQPQPRPADLTPAAKAAIAAFRAEPIAIRTAANRVANGTVAVNSAEIAKAITTYRAAKSKALADALDLTGTAADVAERMHEAADAMDAQLRPAAAGGRR